MTSSERSATPAATELDFSTADWDLRGAVEYKPQTDLELYHWAKAFLKTPTGEPIVLPHKSICKGHSAPFSFVADGFFGRSVKQFLKANRSGSKTFEMALLAFLESYHNGRGSSPMMEIQGIGAVEEQANKFIRYVSGFWNLPEFRDQIAKGGDLKQSITLTNGSVTDTGVATMKRANGPHVPKLFVDELELWDWAVLQQALSIPQTAGGHRAAVRVGSTQKFAAGPVQTFLDQMGARGWKMYTWCIWEVIEKCPPERSCSRCPLLEWTDSEGGLLCGGKARHGGGYYLIDDFIDKVDELDRSTINEEWLCLRPSREGLVYKEYDERVHRLQIDIPYSPDLPLELTLDQGFSNPFAVLYFQPDELNDQLRLIGEEYKVETLPEDMGRIVANRLQSWGVPCDRPLDMILKDPEDPAGAKTFVRHLVADNGKQYHGRIVVPGGKPDIPEWIKFCRRRLKLKDGRPRFIMSRSCQWTAFEFSQWHWAQKKADIRPSSEKPVDKDNHAMSAWYRYEARKHRTTRRATSGKDPRR